MTAGRASRRAPGRRPGRARARRRRSGAPSSVRIGRTGRQPAYGLRQERAGRVGGRTREPRVGRRTHRPVPAAASPTRTHTPARYSDAHELPRPEAVAAGPRGCRRWRRCPPAVSSSTSTAAPRGSRSSPGRNRAGRVEWCLPKGHLEGEETLEEAAVREIAEETGITGRVLASLGTIDYWFSTAEKRGAQGRAPLPARGHRRRAEHRGRPRRRGHRRRVGPAGRGAPSTSPSPTSVASPGRLGSGWQARRDPLTPTRPPRSGRRAAHPPRAGRRGAHHRPRRAVPVRRPAVRRSRDGRNADGRGADGRPGDGDAVRCQPHDRPPRQPGRAVGHPAQHRHHRHRHRDRARPAQHHRPADPHGSGELGRG